MPTHQRIARKITPMTDNIFVFDRNAIRAHRNRSAKHLKDHGFLIDWSLEQILSRLQDIKRQYPLALQIGHRAKISNITDYKIDQLYSLDLAEKLYADIQGDEELLPFAGNSFDLVLSPLSLHNTNDLPGVLSQIQYCLKPDGLFIASMLGGETLYELREIMNKVELNMFNGIQPHVAPFADMPQMGSLMQRAGFNLPVIDSEKITVTYDNAFKLMQDLRLMGESNSLKSRQKNFNRREFFSKVAQEYDNKFNDNGKITATFEIIFLIGWAPHESQQKPLKPGSATGRLAEALETREKKLPC